MKIFRAAAVFALLTVPAYAQSPNINLIPEMRSKSPEEREQDAATDKAYRESLRQIPNAQKAADPWGMVRTPDAKSATTAKPAKKRTQQSEQ